MSLPKINTPTYELVLPSTGKKIKYRPFLVREEKILILAMESEDMNEITNAIIQILSDCIITRDVKVESLATFDIEHVIFVSLLDDLFLLCCPDILLLFLVCRASYSWVGGELRISGHLGTKRMGWFYCKAPKFYYLT